MVPGAGARHVGAGAGDHGGPGLDQHLRDARADALAAAGDEGDTTGEVQGERHPCRLPSKCLVDWMGSGMGITSEVDAAGVRVLTMDFPPVNALPVQGWFDLAAALDEAERRPADPRRRDARRGQGLQRRRRHQGDAEHRGLRRPDRRQPGLLRGVQGGLRVQRAGDRGGQRLLPRRRRRPGRQRRLHRGQRRRLLRHPRGRPRRTRRGHPPGPDGAAAPDAHPLLHRPHDHRRRARPPRLGARGGAARGPRRRGPGGGRRDRRQGHPGDPDGQGGDQRDRPGRRQPQLPLRAGLHDGAQPRRRLRRAPRCLRRHRQGDNDQ